MFPETWLVLDGPATQAVRVVEQLRVIVSHVDEEWGVSSKTLVSQTCSKSFHILNS